MTQDIIQKILDGNYICPQSGENVSVPIQHITIERNARKNLDKLALEGKSCTIVCDHNTYDVLGEYLYDTIDCSNILILEGNVGADEKHVDEITRTCATDEVIIAVGSGTINDLCKYASYLLKIPYIVFGTAPSMNGYASANASITVDGHKKTIAAKPPKAIILDLDILAAAPTRMIQAGFGDSICRSTAQADWLLSHLLFDSYYNPTAFALLIPYEEALLQSSKKLIEGDIETISLLAHTLILSGIGMLISNGSYPASQGEHIIAHTLEMLRGKNKEYDILHGEEIAITTLYMSNLQQTLLAKDKVNILPFSPKEDFLKFTFGEDLGTSCYTETQKKSLSAKQADQINKRLHTQWPHIRQEIQRITLPYHTIKQALEDAKISTQLTTLGWGEEEFDFAARHAHLTRDRFTFLDLAQLST